jgi:hypothetical protein
VHKHHTHCSVESVVERGGTVPPPSSIRELGRQDVESWRTHVSEVRDLWGLGYAKNQRTWVEVIERSVGMGRVWVCILLYSSEIQYKNMVVEKQTLDLWGLGCVKNQRTWVQGRKRNVEMGRVWVRRKNCFMYDVWCGMFTKDGDPSLMINRLHDPAQDQGVFVYYWSIKRDLQTKTYTWESVWWKTKT